MSSLAAAEDLTQQEPAKVIQPVWVRAMHWTNAVAMIMMIMSGWQIYNASPLFGFTFSHSITLGGWLGGALLWHFAAMWLLMVNGFIYLITGFATGRFRRCSTASWPSPNCRLMRPPETAGPHLRRHVVSDRNPTRTCGSP